MNAFNKILDLKQSRIDQIKKEKDSGNKVLGWLCTYTPEEMIHASGIIPYRIFKGGEDSPVATGDSYLQRNICSFTRGCLGYALAGEYDFLDGVVSAHTCDAIRRLPDVWEIYAKTPSFFFQLDLPKNYASENAYGYFKKELLRFKEALEDFSGNKITSENLLNSIEIYNQTRLMLKKIYELRKSANPPISGSDMIKIVQAGMMVDRETYNELLGDLYTELKERTADSNGSPRILITGSIVADGDYKVIELAESLGGLVVCDDLCTGTRYFWDAVYVKNSNDPIDAICRRYLSQVPCSRMNPAKPRLDHVLDLAKEFRVDGVVYYTLKFCDNFQWDLPIFKKELEERKIPVLSIESEYTESDSGQLRTRIEAFLEMVKR